MSPRGSLLGALIVLASSVVYVSAQDAVCLADSAHQWGVNTAGQTPCDVAGSLLSVCLGRDVTIVALDPGRIYSGSQPSGEGNQCRCSSVYYATLAACAQCQGRNWGTWADQIENCAGSISVRTIPISIPPGTIVPSWAYLDYPTVGTFDVNLARSGGTVSSSSIPVISSSTTPSTVISTVLTTVVSSSRPTSSPGGNTGNGGNTGGNTGGTGGNGGNTGGTGGNTGGTGGNTGGGGNGNNGSGNSNGGGDDNLDPLIATEKKTPVGAIVGGVVGGIAAIGLIGGLIAFILIRNKKNANAARPTSMYSEAQGPGMGQTSPFMAPTQNTMNTGMSQPSPYMAPVNPAMTGGSQYYNQPGANPSYPSPQLSPQMYPQGQPQQQGFNQQSPFATPPQSSMGIPSQDGTSYGQPAGGQQPGAYRGVAEI